MRRLCPQLKAEEAAAIRPANDSKPLFNRLVDYSARGCRAPETLTPYEVKQISFALLSRMSLTEIT